MDKLLSFADRLLSLLPFNGDKTIIAGGLKLLLPVAVAKFPPLLLIAPFLDPALDLLLTSGVAHKFVKKAQEVRGQEK